MHTVRVIGHRPDFRVFIDLVYGHGRNVDTDGDSFPVHSREWTELYVKDRESDDPSFEICADDSDLGTFVVTSDAGAIEELVALYLFDYCGATITRERALIDQEGLEALRLKYSVQLKRAGQSPWHRSSDPQPYPTVA